MSDLLRRFGISTAQRSHQFLWLGVVLGCLGGMLPFGLNRAEAAEKVYVSYSILERSIPVASLEKYARTGVIDEDLSVYARYADPAQLKQLRNVLLARAEISPVAVSQFLYSPQGEILLKRLGEVIKSESRLSGFNAIRASLILASSDPEGLTLLNVLRKFPTRGLRIDVQESLRIAGDLEQLVNQTNRATVALGQEAVLETDTDPRAALSTDLRQRGPYTWQQQSFTLIDLNRRGTTGPSTGTAAFVAPIRELLRGRLIPVDLYLPVPDQQARSSQPAPVIVISHGLGSDRESFIYLAQHLASYGFAVLVPEHPGSNAKQLQALINGTASEVAEPTEFVDRPLDITYLLDEMERRVAANPDLQGRLNLQAVGVIGQSFGGYTALAVGGAPINVPELNADCQNLESTLNLSLLLQCRALQLGQTEPNLRDQRVKAIVAMNPITSAVFGEASIGQISVPTLIISGNADTIAPSLSEQIRPFTWLNTPNKYLALIDRATHFSVIGDTNKDDNPVEIPPEVIGPDPAIARRYASALSVAFFKTYVANQSAYRNYLSASYASAISQAPLRLSLVRSFTTEQLTRAIDGEDPSTSGLSTPQPSTPTTP